MPEIGVVAYEGELRAFASDWSLPSGWTIAWAQRSAPYWPGVGSGRPDRLEVDMIHELGHRARILLATDSRHPREWLNPILVAVAGCAYLANLDIDGASAPR